MSKIKIVLGLLGTIAGIGILIASYIGFTVAKIMLPLKASLWKSLMAGFRHGVRNSVYLSGLLITFAIGSAVIWIVAVVVQVSGLRLVPNSVLSIILTTAVLLLRLWHVHAQIRLVQRTSTETG